MKRVILSVFFALLLVLSVALACQAQDSPPAAQGDAAAVSGDADVAKFAQACKTLEGAPVEVCDCAAEALALQVAPDIYNGLADAWLRGELLAPTDAAQVYGQESINKVEEAFDACQPQ